MNTHTVNIYHTFIKHLGPNPLPPEGGCCAPALPPGLAIEWSEDPPAEKGLTTASLTKSFRGFSLATMTVSSIGAAGLGLLWILPPVAPTFCCGEAMRPPWDRFGPPRGVADWDWGLRLGRMRMADRGVISRGLSIDDQASGGANDLDMGAIMQALKTAGKK